ncbi:uncharacterized protein [Paramisgurnus dabryanus]|uniref:uncharacterized protein isoform X2 n=1 Tax=Paramisgurnus dabryanus TaxID=90735 RepID=UPI0031F3CEEC
MMGGVNVVLLVLLVWTFTAVCGDKTEITSNCEDGTAHNSEINLNCTVTYPNKNCCMTMYKFINTAAADDPTICREEFSSDSCKQERRVSCPYTANKAMTTKVKFFLQTKCGKTETYFSVSRTGAVEDVTAANTATDKPGGTNTLRYKEVLAVIIPVIICLIVIIMWFILKKKLNFNTCGFHRNYDTDVSERNISLYSDREAVEQ